MDYKDVRIYITESVLPSVDKLKVDRKSILDKVAQYIVEKRKHNKVCHLMFICTHNSRRSQFAQIWAQVAARHFGVDEVFCYSGGIEVTAFHQNAVDAVKRAGLSVVQKENGHNPVFFVHYHEDEDPISAFSKVYDDALNPQTEFAAVMVCADADENCPFVPGTELRISLPYDDPRHYDNTGHQDVKYDERCLEIAVEMFYVFRKVKASI